MKPDLLEPDQKNDEQSHYDKEFDKLISSPGNLALDDQLDATARDEEAKSNNPSQSDYSDKFNDAYKALGNAGLAGNPDASTLDDDTLDSLAEREKAARADKSRSAFEDANEERKKHAAAAGELPYNPEDEGGEVNQKKRRSIRIRRGLAAVGVTTILGVGTIGIFNALLPTRIITLMETTRDRFSSSSQRAVSQRRDQLFSHWVKAYVLKGLGPRCTSSATRGCTLPVQGESQFAYLANGWKDARLENTLAEKHGIEFKWEKGSGVSATTQSKYTMAIRGGQPIDLNDFANSGGRGFGIFGGPTLADAIDSHGRAEVRAQYKRVIKEALDGESRFKQAWLRFKVGKLLERKYHLERCTFACRILGSERVDNYRDNRDFKRNARKLKLIEVVIEPRSQTAAIVMECIMAPEKCKGGGGGDGNGKERTAVEKKIEDSLEKYRRTQLLSGKSEAEAAEKVDDLLRKAGLIGEKGLTGYIVEDVFSKVLTKAGAKALNKAIPYVGWVDLALVLQDLALNAPEMVETAKYAMMAASAIKLYQMNMSLTDECKSGHCDTELLGSMSKGLDAGGDQDSTKSPLYQAAISGESTSTSFWQGSAYAQGGRYKCGENGDGDELEVGKLICPEESFEASGALNAILEGGGAIASFVGSNDNPGAWPNNYVLKPAWEAIVRPVINLPGKILGPAVTNLGKAVGLDGFFESFGEYVQSFIMEYVLGGTSLGPDSTGARNTQTIIAGAAAMNTENCNSGMGCKELSDSEVTAMAEEEAKEQRYAMSQKPLFERLFSKEDMSSMVSKIALDSPTKPRSLIDRSINYAFNPLPSVSQFTEARFAGIGYAQSNISKVKTVNDALGIRTLGIPSNDPALSVNPEKLTPEYCEEYNEKWFKGSGTHSMDGTNFDNTKITDPDTSYVTHKNVNPCLLEEQATGAAGAMYTDEVLKEDEINDGTEDSTVDTDVSLPGVQCPANLEAHPDKSGYYKVPNAPNGEYDFNGGTPDSQRWGSKQLVCVIYSVALAYNSAMGGRSKMNVHDLNASGHKSHNTGVALDVSGRGELAAANHTGSRQGEYSTEATITMGKLFIDTGVMKNIWWCDPKDGSLNTLIEYAKQKGTPFVGAKCLSGHENHFHVDIKDEYKLEFWEPNDNR